MEFPKKKNTVWNCVKKAQNITEGDLIIFPSWLEHDVPVNTSEFDRLSLSFNIMCRGEYGMKNSRQEVIL